MFLHEAQTSIPHQKLFVLLCILSTWWKCKRVVKMLQQLTSLDLSYFDILPNRVSVSQSWANILNLVLISIVKKETSVRNLSDWPMSYLGNIAVLRIWNGEETKDTITKSVSFMFWNGDWGFAHTDLASNKKSLGISRTPLKP